MASPRNLPERPGVLWRFSGSMVMGLTALLSKAFLYGLNTVKVEGLENLTAVLDRRRKEGRERGLLTVCNHTSVLDDPLIWGILPMRHSFGPKNLRWTLGAHDICFKNDFTSNFFSVGQVLPTHRLLHSIHGGIFQPTLSQAIRLLSEVQDQKQTRNQLALPPPESLTFSTNAKDQIHAPSAYACNRKGWVHVFPEGYVHQAPHNALRYFKWGVSRLVLESRPTPDIIPMFITGTEKVLAEGRPAPRWLPRIGQEIRVVISPPIDVEAVFGDQIAAWRALEERNGGPAPDDELPAELRNGKEAQRIRIEVAKRLRDQVLALRRGLGYPEDVQVAELAETWFGTKTKPPPEVKGVDGKT